MKNKDKGGIRMKRAKHVRRGNSGKVVSILTILLLFALFSATCFPLSHALQKVDSPSLSTLAGQVAIEGALSAKPEIVAESAPAVEIAPEKQALPNDPYPLLYTEKISPKEDDSKEKIAYLTFDDGPSDLTIPLLDVLDRYQVKATFFLVGKTGEEDRKAMREIVKRGHAIAVHSYSHDYREIYASVDAYLADFAKMHDLILKETGVDTPLYRFAGGSINSYNRDTAKAIIEEMNRRGYTYFDWNVDSGDATRGTTAQQIYQHAVNDSKQFRRPVILFHNTGTKKMTLEQIPAIIEALQKEGYRFDVLKADTPSVRFRIPETA